ncbi:hypothetical protein [Corynebacterium casei]|uniref:hypothetical protein n=1 Tax=Corynebacterium casei TaxID=160386 RepID=UPI003F95DDCF
MSQRVDFIHQGLRDFTWLDGEETHRCKYPGTNLRRAYPSSKPRARHNNWEELEQALLDISAPQRIDDNDASWPTTDIEDSTDAEALEVLSQVQHLPAHMKLAAFTLGAHTCTFEGTITANFGEDRKLRAHPGHLAHR